MPLAWDRPCCRGDVKNLRVFRIQGVLEFRVILENQTEKEKDNE